MIRVHSTKKLLAKLTTDERGRRTSDRPDAAAANDGEETLLSGWPTGPAP